MSKDSWFASDALKKQVYDTVEKIIVQRTQLEEEEIEKVKPLYKKHFVEQMKLKPEDRVLFQDEWGGTILFLQTPEEPKKKLNLTQSKNYLIYGTSALLELGNIKMFIEDIEGIWNRKAIFRGRLKIQYKLIGSSKFPMNVKQFIKHVNEQLENPEDHIESIDELDESEYVKAYTINIWQAIAVIE